MLLNELKSLLAPYLGTFNLLNQPSIAYENSNYSRDITGILCLLPYISTTPPAKLLGGANFFEDRLVIRLINYDTTPSMNLKNCLDLLYSQYDVIDQVYTSGDKQIFEQIKATLLIQSLTT
jgi:hypothetical protein